MDYLDELVHMDISNNSITCDGFCYFFN